MPTSGFEGALEKVRRVHSGPRQPMTFGDHLGDNEVAELRRALRHLLEKNGAWQEARCNPILTKPR